MVEDPTYVATIIARTERLSSVADALKKRQHETVSRRNVLRKSFHMELHSLEEQLVSLEEELHLLAQSAKKLVRAFQHVALQGQLSVISERANMLPIQNWVSRKELKKMIKE